MPEHADMMAAIIEANGSLHKPPAYQFYVRDWLGSITVRTMTAEQRGWYIDLMAYCWDERDLALPADDAKLAALSGAREKWATDGAPVRACLSPHPSRTDCLTIIKLVEVRYAQLSRALSGQNGGRKSSKTQANVKQSSSKTQAKPKQEAKQTSSKTQPFQVLQGLQGLQDCQGSQGLQHSSTPAVADVVDNSVDNSPKPEPKLNAQAQAVKDCLDAYIAGYAVVVGKPYDGQPPAGAVVRWLGSQPLRDGAVSLFGQAVGLAVKAHKLDPQFHAFAMTVPKFVSRLPELNGAYLDAAKRNANRSAGRQGSWSSCRDSLKSACVSQGEFARCEGCPEYEKQKQRIRARQAGTGTGLQRMKLPPMAGQEKA